MSGLPGRMRGLAQELRSLPTVVLLLCCLFVGLPLAAAATPDRHVAIAGQDIAVGARVPGPTLSGPAQLVQLGNTRFDLSAIQVWGPLRPQLSLGPLQRNDAAAAAVEPDTLSSSGSAAMNTLIQGFLTWYLWATCSVVIFAVAVTAIIACGRIVVTLRRKGSAPTPSDLSEVSRTLSATIGRMAVLAIAVSLLGWAASGVAAYQGTVEGLRGVGSLSDLVGTSEITPSPVGPPLFGYAGAVIGDSRVARVGGPPLPEATADDIACERSADSPAAALARIRGEKVLNLACSGASIAAGLRGPQQRGDTEIAPQIGRLKQVRGLDWVAVAIGPNDVNWSDFLLYCYGLPTCDDQLSAGEFDLRMAGFDRDWAALLADLADLPGHPRIVVITSYDAFPANPPPACPDLLGPAGTPGLDPTKVALLADRNSQLNDVLETGARQYGFAIARPALTPLCGGPSPLLGPDLQGLAGPHPFHPTAVGSLRLAASVANVIGPPS